MRSPSNSQMKAIKHGCGTMLVLAGPGSGKTFVIIQRILNLILEKHIKPEHILVISFSKASTLELKQRFQKQIKEHFKNTLKESNNTNHFITQPIKNNESICEENQLEECSKVNFATFHACFFYILKETYHYTSKDIITEKQKRELIKTVLSMQIVGSKKALEKYLKTAVEINTEQPVLVDKYITGRELEVDAVCDGRDVFVPGIMEHVEKTGIHSGDSISVYPTFSISEEAKEKILEYTVKLGLGIGIEGLYNIQFIVDKEDNVYVIEVNPRSSRTVPST